MTTVTATPICPLDQLAVERGAAALIELDGPGGRVTTQIALFRLLGDEVYAVQQVDPFSGANVISRGLVGTRGTEPTVASPVYKQVFSLRTGECLESAGYTPVEGRSADLTSFHVEVIDGTVHVGPARTAGSLSVHHQEDLNDTSHVRDASGARD